MSLYRKVLTKVSRRTAAKSKLQQIAIEQKRQHLRQVGRPGGAEFLPRSVGSRGLGVTREIC